MSGSRVKALRRDFKRLHGRAPEGARWAKTRTLGPGILGKLLSVKVAQPSEWRQWKKAFQRRRTCNVGKQES